VSTRDENRRPGGEIVVYQSDDGGGRIRVLLAGNTVWLTQAQIAELFETTKQNVSLHSRNIFEDGIVLGLMTIGPVTTGHALVIPKQHFAYLADMDEGTGRHLWTGERTRRLTWRYVHDAG
jgi:diadenosine tetraphosphate (Ap4A) HIT family hydrolase